AVDRALGDVRVVRVVEAFACGAIVNPDGLRNQVVGAIIQGLGGALFEAVEFENGQIKNPRFATYRVPRFRDVPEIEAVLLDRKSTRLNSSHVAISYAVFCLKKKNPRTTSFSLSL